MQNCHRSLALALTLGAGVLALLQACAPQPAPVRPEPHAPPAAAAPSLDGRMLADAREYPWSALGRVNLAGRGFCTGILIGPRQMLTQARCLYAEREGRWFQPLELHVVAGYQRDSFLADSGIADFTVSPGFNPRAGTSLTNLTSNWALLTLREPIGAQTGWLGLEWENARLQAAARAGTAAYLRAGYRQDRPHAVSLHFGCSAEAESAAGLCQATPNERGLPPFVIIDGGLRVLADFYAATPSQESALARLSGSPLSGQRLGDPQPPALDGLAGHEPTATASTLLAALRYDVSGGKLGAAAAAFRRENGLPASESIDIDLLAALLSAAYRSGR